MMFQFLTRGIFLLSILWNGSLLAVVGEAIDEHDQFPQLERSSFLSLIEHGSPDELAEDENPPPRQNEMIHSRKLFNEDGDIEIDNDRGRFTCLLEWNPLRTSSTTKIFNMGVVPAGEAITCKIHDCGDLDGVDALQISMKFGSIFTSIDDGTPRSASGCPVLVELAPGSEQVGYVMLAASGSFGVECVRVSCTSSTPPPTTPAPTPFPTFTPFPTPAPVPFPRPTPTSTDPAACGRIIGRFTNLWNTFWGVDGDF